MEAARAAGAPEATATAAPATVSGVLQQTSPPSPPRLSPLPASPSPGVVSTLVAAPPPLPPAPVVPRRARGVPPSPAAARGAARPPAHYLAPTAATTARRRTLAESGAAQLIDTPTARPHRSSSSAAAAAADGAAGAPSSSRHSSRRAHSRPTARPRIAASTTSLASPAAPQPHVSFIDAVLDAQFTTAGSAEATARPAALAADAPPLVSASSEPALVQVTEAVARRRGPRRRGSGLSAPAQRAGPPPLRVSDTEDELSDAGEDANTAPLRLQPLAPPGTFITSALVEETLAVRTGLSDGAYGHPETFADVMIEPTLVPTRTRHRALTSAAAAPLLASSAAQSVLAAERATLLEDSTDHAAGVHGGGRALDTEASQARIWQPPTPDATARAAGGSAPTLPAAIVEFLRAEAAAEAEVLGAQTAAQPQTAYAAPAAGAAVASRVTRAAALGRPTAQPPQHAAERHRPPPPSVSPAAESAAVLRELQDVQRRLHAHGHREEATPAKTAESASPCDVSTSASDESSTSSTGNPRGSGVAAMGGRGRDPAYWATASITEIVDAIDGRSAALRQHRSRSRGSARTPPRHRRGRRSGRGTPHASGGTAVVSDFDPEVYARRLLDATGPSALGSDHSSVSDDDRDVGMDGVDDLEAPGVGLGEHTHEHGPNDHPHRLVQLSFSQHRRDALLRAGPTWATAASEMGLTPREVQDLLRYSVSYPGGAIAAGPVALEVDAHASQARRPHSTDTRGGGAGTSAGPHDPASEERRERRRLRDTRGGSGTGSAAAGTLADTAAQAALVQRVVAALPAIPPELQAELGRQRRLLERVCRDVRVMSEPAHAAVRARLSSPTVAFAVSRQPSPVEFHTSASPADARGGGTQREAEEGEADAEAQRVFLASLPRPAARALRTVSGLHRVAADPSTSLPPFHAVVAQPQPYEAALHELAERETRHYVSELDRLRSTYDRQLQEERRERHYEQRQYAELLQAQQQRLLRHHRETVNLLQRETRLQEGQRAALVQQLAASQAAAAQRQQAQHERATRHMLAGAVDVVKGYAAAAAAEEQRAVQADRDGALQRHQQQRQEAQQRQQRARRRSTPQPQPSMMNTTTATPPRRLSRTTPQPHHGADRKTRRSLSTRAASPRAPSAAAAEATLAEAREATPAPSTELSTAAAAAYSGDVDADIPTAGHLTPLRHSQGTRPSSPSREAAVAAATSATPTRSVDDEGDEEGKGEGGSPAAPSQPTVRPTPPGPVINSSAVLRAVYGTSSGDARRVSPPAVAVHLTPPPPSRRMTLPLRVRLPPEDDYVPQQTRAALAVELRDWRAVTAAREAGLVEGTRLYGVPARRRVARGTAAAKEGDLGDARVGRSVASAPRRHVPRHPPSPPRRASRSAEAPVVRGRGGRGGRGGSMGHGRAAERRSRSAPSPPLPPPPTQRHRFDVETVSLLSSEAGGAAPSAGQAPPAQHHHPPSVNPHAAASLLHAPPAAMPAVQYGGAWSEAIAHAAQQRVHGGAVSPGAAPPPVVANSSDDGALHTEAATVAQRPAVGRALIVLSPPTRGTTPMTLNVTHIDAAAPATAATTAAVAAAAAADTDEAQLTLALQHRMAVVDALRREAAAAVCGDVEGVGGSTAMVSREPTAGATTTTAVDADGEGGAHAAVAVRRAVGALPPCDAAFFGAPAEVLGYGDAGGVANAVDAAVPWTLLTDYARAWTRVAAAEREVVRHAGALAAEDAGVLEAIAGPAEAAATFRSDGATSEGAAAASAAQASGARGLVPLPRPASAAAAVRYRKQQQLASDAGAGGFYVSPRIAAEARALTEARQRLAAIKRCFITPSPLLTRGRLQGSGDGDGSAAAVRRAEVLRQLVDATTVQSVLETHGADPMRRLMAAIEDELLRLMLASRLDAAASPRTSPPRGAEPTPQSPVTQLVVGMDDELARALAEATLQDAVYAALAQSHAASYPRHPGVAAAAAASDKPQPRHEHVRIPRVAATAWLEDAAETGSPAVGVAHDVLHPDGATDRADAGGASGRATTAVLAAAPPAVNGQGADAATSTATPVAPAMATVLVPLQPPSRAADGSATPAAQEVRVVVDLSPAMQHVMTGLRAGVAGDGPRRWYPPMQQEQLPSPWLAMEDRRDVIVQVERRPTETVTEAPTLPLQDAPAMESIEISKMQDGAGSRAEPELAAATAALSLPQVPADAVARVSVGAPSVSLSPALSLPPPPPPPLVSSEVPGWAAGSPATPAVAADVPNTPPPPHDTPAPASAISPTLLLLLLRSLCDQEQQQRAGLVDREEEQRHAVERLRVVARDVVAHRRTATPKPSAELAAVSSPEASPSRATSGMAAPPPPPPPAAPPPQPLSLPPSPSHVASASRSAAAAASSVPSVPPPVRDPVMSFVLEWVRQFGGDAASQPASLPRRRSRSSARASSAAAAAAAGLMKGLTAAAQTAASPPEPQVDVALALVAPSPDPRVRYAASGPSTRNLGTSTSSIASTSTASPSLPSSLRTASSSDSASSATPSALRPGAAQATPSVAHAAEVYRHAPTRKSRPVLDTQRRRGNSGSTASTATTRYTSSDTHSTSRARDDTAPVEDVGAAGAAHGPSRLLPPRASVEVQAALAAALRAHQCMADADDAAAAAATSAFSAVAPSAAAGAPEVSFASAMGNSSYAVTLPAASAETTAIGQPAAAAGRGSPYRGAGAGHDGLRRHKAPGQPDELGALVPAAATTAPASVFVAAAAAWSELSLTSTSTSSRSGATRHPARGQPPSQRAPAAALPTAGTTTTTTTTTAATATTRTATGAPPSFPLPFQTTRAVVDEGLDRARGEASAAAAPPAAHVTSPPHAVNQVLQAQVQRIQQEQRARVPW